MHENMRKQTSIACCTVHTAHHAPCTLALWAYVGNGRGCVMCDLSIFRWGDGEPIGAWAAWVTPFAKLDHASWHSVRRRWILGLCSTTVEVHTYLHHTVGR